MMTRLLVSSVADTGHLVNESEQPNPGHESALLPLIDAVSRGSAEYKNQLMSQLRSYFHLIVQHELSPKLRHKVGNSDVVQQSCVKVIEGINGFRGTTEGELRNWLKRVITNEINQVGRELRAKKRDVRREVSVVEDSQLNPRPFDPVDAMLTPRANALAEERKEAVRSALSRLPEEYQRVIAMRSWEGMTFPQIAQKLDRSINATEKLWYRAIKRLRFELRKFDELSQ